MTYSAYSDLLSTSTTSFPTTFYSKDLMLSMLYDFDFFFQWLLRFILSRSPTTGMNVGVLPVPTCPTIMLRGWSLRSLDDLYKLIH